MLTSLRQLVFSGGIDLIVPWGASEILYGYPIPRRIRLPSRLKPILHCSAPYGGPADRGYALMALGRSLQRSVSAITLLAWTPSGQEAKIGRWRQLSSTRPYVLSRFATETSIRGHRRQLRHLQRMRYVGLNSAASSFLMWLCCRLATTLWRLISPSFTGIGDPLCDGVQEAVSKCHKVSVTVKMCTGDNVLTARSIALQCGIDTAGGSSR